MDLNAIFHAVVLACETGEINIIRKYEGKYDVDTADENDVSLLQIAASNGQNEVVKELLCHGAKVNAANKLGWTALMQASAHGHTEVCQTLLKKRAHINGENKYGATALHMAAASGHLSTVKVLLEYGAALYFTSKDNDKRKKASDCPTLLMTASMFNYEHIIRTLIKRGADVNDTIEDTNWSSLMFAAVNGNKPAAQILVERGANPDLKNISNFTALDLSSLANHREVSAYLSGKTQTLISGIPERSDNGFMSAVRLGDIDGINSLLASKRISEINLMGNDGATPLMLSVLLGKYEITEVLLKAGAKVDIQDYYNGWTALMQAVFYSHHAIAALLLHHGADPSLPAHNGCTALDLATLVDESDTEVLRLLARKTIHFSPPTLAFQPPDNQNLGNGNANNGDDTAMSGKFKVFWDKLAGQFIKRRNSNLISDVPKISVEQDVEVIDSLEQCDGLIVNGVVFTLGFKSANFLPSDDVRPVTPKIDSDDSIFLNSSINSSDRTISSPHKMEMPDGKCDELSLNKLSFIGSNNLQSQKKIYKNNNSRYASYDSEISSPSNSQTFAETSTSNQFAVNKNNKGLQNRYLKRQKRSSNLRSLIQENVFDNSSNNNNNNNERSQKNEFKEYHDLRNLLSSLKLTKYYSLFHQEEVDTETFYELSDIDLKELGINNLADRKKILSAISEKP